jgi:hypothetical protein
MKVEKMLTNAPTIGHNITSYAEGIPDRLELDYAELKINAMTALDATESLPVIIETSADVEPIASAIKKLGDLAGRATAHRVAEKEPYLRAGDAVFAWFTKGLIEPLNAKREQLRVRLDSFKQRQLAEERAKREAEAAIARAQQIAAQKAREEAEAAARRARSVETAELRAAEARQARVEADMAAARAEQTTLATMASSSAMIRERFEGERSGHVGMRKKKIAVVTDIAKLDLERLRHFFKQEHLEYALRAWAAATDYDEQMPGAIVTKTDTTVVR